MGAPPPLSDQVTWTRVALALGAVVYFGACYGALFVPVLRRYFLYVTPGLTLCFLLLTVFLSQANARKAGELAKRYDEMGGAEHSENDALPAWLHPQQDAFLAFSVGATTALFFSIDIEAMLMTMRDGHMVAPFDSLPDFSLLLYFLPLFAFISKATPPLLAPCARRLRSRGFRLGRAIIVASIAAQGMTALFSAHLPTFPIMVGICGATCVALCGVLFLSARWSRAASIPTQVAPGTPIITVLGTEMDLHRTRTLCVTSIAFSILHIGLASLSLIHGKSFSPLIGTTVCILGLSGTVLHNNAHPVSAYASTKFLPNSPCHRGPAQQENREEAPA